MSNPYILKIDIDNFQEQVQADGPEGIQATYTDPQTGDKVIFHFKKAEMTEPQEQLNQESEG